MKAYLCNVRIVVSLALLFLTGCSSSTNSEAPQSVIPTVGDTADGIDSGEPDIDSGSSIPIAIEKTFWGDSSVAVELFVYSKTEAYNNTLLEQYSVERNSLSELANGALRGIEQDALVFFGAVDSDGISLGVLWECTPAHLETENIYTYYARSTDLSGETVTIINGDSCGSHTLFPFNSIDGQSLYEWFKLLRDEIAAVP
jgi:hypothetical protein